MTAKISGGANLARFLNTLPDKLERNVLRGAMKAGAEVIAERARELVPVKSGLLREDINTAVSAKEKGLVTAKVQVKGKHAFIAPWIEFGTAEHFIKVDKEKTGGMTASRVNTLVEEGSLIINGHFVGAIVHHPGTAPNPFMRTAADQAQDAAIAAIGAHIKAKMTPTGLNSPGPAAEAEE